MITSLWWISNGLLSFFVHVDLVVLGMNMLLDKYFSWLFSCHMYPFLFSSRFSDPARGIDPGRGEGQRVRGSTGSNRGSTGGIDPVYI